MVIPEDDKCRSALRQAKLYASKMADGVMSPIEGARQIAPGLGDCYEFIGGDFELVDLLAAIAGRLDEYEELQLDPVIAKEIESDILEAAREFVRSAAALA